MVPGEYEVIKIKDNEYRIEEQEARCFLFVGTEKALLVDTGYTLNNVREIVESITDLPIVVVNTHADRDHVACNDQFEDVYMHPGDYEIYHKIRKQFSNVKPIWGGDVIDIGNRRFEIIHIPGHTPGSVALLDTENRILIGGDSIGTGDVWLFGPGRDLLAYVYSFEELIKRFDQFDWVYTSHFGFPASGNVVATLYEGAMKLLNGDLEGEGTLGDSIDGPFMDYDLGVAKIRFECNNPYLNSKAN